MAPSWVQGCVRSTSGPKNKTHVSAKRKKTKKRIVVICYFYVQFLHWLLRSVRTRCCSWRTGCVRRRWPGWWVPRAGTPHGSRPYRRRARGRPGGSSAPSHSAPPSSSSVSNRPCGRRSTLGSSRRSPRGTCAVLMVYDNTSECLKEIDCTCTWSVTPFPTTLKFYPNNNFNWWYLFLRKHRAQFSWPWK